MSVLNKQDQTVEEAKPQVSDQIEIKQDNADKQIDSQKMIVKLEENQTVQQFCTSDLKKNKQFNRNTIILVSNYTFLLRLLGIHLILVGLVHGSEIQVMFLIVLELTYFGISLSKYLSKKHLRSIRFLIPKVIQSLFLLTFEFSIVVQSFNSSRRKLSISKNKQKFLIHLLFWATIFEYLVLATNLGWLIYELIANRNKTKVDFIEYIQPKIEVKNPLFLTIQTFPKKIIFHFTYQYQKEDIMPVPIQTEALKKPDSDKGTTEEPSNPSIPSQKQENKVSRKIDLIDKTVLKKNNKPLNIVHPAQKSKTFKQSQFRTYVNKKNNNNSNPTDLEL